MSTETIDAAVQSAVELHLQPYLELLEQIRVNTTKPEPTPDDLLSVEEVTAQYGLKRATLYNYKCVGKIKGVKRGKHLYFRRADLDELMEPK